MFHIIKEDIQTVFQKDPAARSLFEVLTCYPGLHAIWMHRVSHKLWHWGFKLLARHLSQWNRFWTNIEIHPGATIGRQCFIDHGAGVVIGETAAIGNNVLLYQGVVLGGTSCKKEKRHPTIEDDVIIGARSVLLGPIVIGSGAKIGAGSVIIKDVPPEKTVVGVPGRVAGSHEHLMIDLEHANLPDPVLDTIQTLLDQQKHLKDELKGLKKRLGKQK